MTPTWTAFFLGFTMGFGAGIVAGLGLAAYLGYRGHRRALALLQDWGPPRKE